MSINWLLLEILLLSTLALLDAHHLKGKDWGGRIMNGNPIDIIDAPYQISLQINGKHYCGGSILSEEIIVTAAHCLVGKNISELSVRAGSTKWKYGGQSVEVSHLKMHESFSKHSFDIAVLRLRRPLKLGPKVQTISLAKESPKNGAIAFISGWGSVKLFAGSSDTLQGACVPVIDRNTCQYIYGRAITITNELMCAGGKRKDSCFGDSGGPVVSNGQLVGVVNAGVFCGAFGFPGINADIAYFFDWLNTAINELTLKEM